MPKAQVTTQLSETIKNLRIQNRISSKSLAAHIKKSPAYVTKLEKGDIQTIDIQELSAILHFITNESSSIAISEQIYSSLKIKYTEKEIDAQLWFRNFDTIDRQIPIPDQLVEYINNLLTSHSISRDYLNNRINSNEALDDQMRNDSSIPNNVWFSSTNGDNYNRLIKISLPEDTQNSILDKKQSTCSYMFMFCIVFYTRKIVEYDKLTKLSDKEYTELYNRTTEILNSHHFYSIAERNLIIGKEISQTNEKIAELLSVSNREYAGYIENILKQLTLAADYNIENTNRILNTFSENMQWDIGFILSLLGIQFHKLDNISFNKKKALLNEIKELLYKYQELPTAQKQIEDYSDQDSEIKEFF